MVKYHSPLIKFAAFSVFDGCEAGGDKFEVSKYLPATILVFYVEFNNSPPCSPATFHCRRVVQNHSQPIEFEYALFHVVQDVKEEGW